MRPSTLRAIPAVEKVLIAMGEVALPRAAVTAIVRRELTAIRLEEVVPPFDLVLRRIREALRTVRQSRLQPVINATGILIHTNLGRAPLGAEVIEDLKNIAANYNNLEYDLLDGGRGGRAAYLETHLALLCGAQSVTVVNNCAAALLLTLRHFTRTKREVIISRGELVQIGGGFRIPDILEASGAKLREIGTTNKTDLNDYKKAMGPETAMILKVHRSNFFMAGFVESARTEEIAALAKRKRIPLVEDLGSGAAIATEKLAELEHEPTPAEVLKRGVDLVTFSGDKLLGGPQAGIVAGTAKWVAALKREPFFRALRCDKLVLSALQSTVDIYLNGTPEGAIPVLNMLRISTTELRSRAEKILAALQNEPLNLSIGQGKAEIGGGTLPRSVIPSVTVDVQPQKIPLSEFVARLRAVTPPIIGYISGGRVKLDLRTVFASQDAELIQGVRGASSANFQL